MHNFRKIKIWQKSVEFTVKVYHFSAGFPKEERYGMVSQMRRAGVSIPSNIAEGNSKSSKKYKRISLETSLGRLLNLKPNWKYLIGEKELTIIEDDLVELQ